MSRSITLVPAIGRSPALSPLDRIAAAASRLTREFRLRRDLRTLGSLDDRTLADIGIGRGEVERAVRFGRGAVSGRQAVFAPIRLEAPLMPAAFTEWP